MGEQPEPAVKVFEARGRNLGGEEGAAHDPCVLPSRREFFCDGLHAERLGAAGERLDLGYPGPEIVRATPGREVFKAAEATAA